MKKSIYSLAIAAVAALACGEASAATYVLGVGTNYGATFTVNANGTLSLLGTTAQYNAVQQQDKLWDEFSLHKGETVVFSFSTINGVDTHSISIGGNLSSKLPTTVGYDISVIPTSSRTIVTTASDIVQSAGKSELKESLTPGGTGVIDFSKNSLTSPPTYIGNTSYTFAVAPTLVAVTETIKPDLKGTNISFIQNSFVQSAPAPGPVPGVGLLGSAALLGFFLTAKARASRG